MGYIRHHAVVVTGHQWEHDRTPDSDVRDAHAAAVACGCVVTRLVDGAINSYSSFMVVPDGSKEGWDESDTGDRARGRFIDWLRKANGEDGWFSWAELVLGDDDCEALVERHAWDGAS